MGGIPDEKAGILASATIFSWGSRSRGVASLKSELRLAPVELVRLPRIVLWKLHPKNFHLLLFPESFVGPFFHHPI